MYTSGHHRPRVMATTRFVNRTGAAMMGPQPRTPFTNGSAKAHMHCLPPFNTYAEMKNIRRTPLKPNNNTQHALRQSHTTFIHHTQLSIVTEGRPRPRHKRVYVDLHAVCTHRVIIGPRHVNETVRQSHRSSHGVTTAAYTIQ